MHDVRSEMRRLTEELGIPVSALSVLEGIVAYCDFVDPDGNRLGLFQDLATKASRRSPS